MSTRKRETQYARELPRSDHSDLEIQLLQQILQEIQSLKETSPTTSGLPGKLWDGAMSLFNGEKGLGEVAGEAMSSLGPELMDLLPELLMLL
jgi:hypothetical protein